METHTEARTFRFPWNVSLILLLLVGRGERGARGDYRYTRDCQSEMTDAAQSKLSLCTFPSCTASDLSDLFLYTHHKHTLAHLKWLLFD